MTLRGDEWVCKQLLCKWHYHIHIKITEHLVDINHLNPYWAYYVDGVWLYFHDMIWYTMIYDIIMIIMYHHSSFISIVVDIVVVITTIVIITFVSNAFINIIIIIIIIAIVIIIVVIIILYISRHNICVRRMDRMTSIMKHIANFNSGILKWIFVIGFKWGTQLKTCFSGAVSPFVTAPTGLWLNVNQGTFHQLPLWLPLSAIDCFI